MNYLYHLLISIFLISAINYVQYKFNFLLDIQQKHKINFSYKIPLSGGVYIVFSLILFKNIFSSNFQVILIFCLISFFILGFFSDTKPNFKPLLRLFLQLLLIFIFLFLTDLSIDNTTIFFIDKFITNNFFNIIFTAICIVVFLNGSNFIDGVNANLVGYNIIVLFFLNNYNNDYNLYFLLITFSTFYIFNIFGKCFLGDNGVYIISILISYLTIDIINSNELNPLIALNLLWYPAFENLFSIIRRQIYKTKIDKADKKHLHTLLFLWIRKFKFNLIISNSLTGITLNIFNFVSLYLSMQFINNNQMLISILILNVTIYLIIYFKLLSLLPIELDSKK